jgi:hypothetical protein
LPGHPADAEGLAVEQLDPIRADHFAKPVGDPARIDSGGRDRSHGWRAFLSVGGSPGSAQLANADRRASIASTEQCSLLRGSG